MATNLALWAWNAAQARVMLSAYKRAHHGATNLPHKKRTCDRPPQAAQENHYPLWDARLAQPMIALGPRGQKSAPCAGPDNLDPTQAPHPRKRALLALGPVNGSSPSVRGGERDGSPSIPVDNRDGRRPQRGDFDNRSEHRVSSLPVRGGSVPQTIGADAPQTRDGPRTRGQTDGHRRKLASRALSAGLCRRGTPVCFSSLSQVCAVGSSCR